VTQIGSILLHQDHKKVQSHSTAPRIKGNVKEGSWKGKKPKRPVRRLR
jgi:hypothetical protein